MKVRSEGSGTIVEERKMWVSACFPAFREDSLDCSDKPLNESVGTGKMRGGSDVLESVTFGEVAEFTGSELRAVVRDKFLWDAVFIEYASELYGDSF